MSTEVKKKLRSVDENASSLSQVESASVTRYDDTDSSFNGDLQLFLSQPVRLCDMLVSTQLLNTQSSSTQVRCNVTSADVLIVVVFFQLFKHFSSFKFRIVCKNLLEE